MERLEGMMKRDPEFHSNTYINSKSGGYNFSFGQIPPPPVGYSATEPIPKYDSSLQLLKEINVDLNSLENHLYQAFPVSDIPLNKVPKIYQESAEEIGTQYNPMDNKVDNNIKDSPEGKAESALGQSPGESLIQPTRSITKTYRALTYSPYYKGKIKEEPFRCIKDFYRSGNPANSFAETQKSLTNA